MKRRFVFGVLVLSAIVAVLHFGNIVSGQEEEKAKTVAVVAPENSTPQSLPFSQNWTTTTLITTNDDWAGVPGIVGFLGDYDAASPTNVDPRTLLTPFVTNNIDVIAQATNPDSLTSGGVAEFDTLANPVVALNGSGTADAPHIIVYANTTGRTSINLTCSVRDLDGSADDAAQQFNVQYRVGSSGNYANVTGGYFADVTTGGTATQVTAVNVTLPADANNQPVVEIRLMSTNAGGNDEWIGIDDINVTGTAGGGGGPVVGPKLFKAYLNSANEVPPNASTATGFGRVVLNDTETSIKASIYWNNLSGNATSGHIHGPAAVGTNASPIFNLNPPAQASGSVVDFTTAVTPTQVAELKAGLWYFNIHTAANTGGEIRGQILRAKPRFDTDGDGDSDYGVIRAGAGGASGQATWFTSLNQGTPADPFTETQWGLNSDTATPEDFDGDGKTDIAFWRPSGTPAFFILRSTTGTLQQVNFGLAGDDPTIVADYSGDGKADPALYRRGATATSQSFFWTLPSSGPLAGVQVVNPWGLGGDNASSGDFDGDGRADFCVTRNFSGANVFIIYTATGVVSYTSFGLSGASPDAIAPGDYDGDGRTDLAVTRFESGNIAWYYRPSGGGVDTRVAWGVTASSDYEAQGDYDGDGKTDIAVWRPSGGSTFFVVASSGGFRFQRWGIDQDVPSIFDLH